MQTKQSLIPVLRRTAALTGLCICLSVSVPAKDFQFTASSSVPAARGRVEFDTDKSGNNKVKVKVEHLALPANLTPPRSAYIVWFQQSDGQPAIQGVLKVNHDLQGEFETSTPWKSFKVFVTAEDNTSPASPSGQEILSATVQQ
jgi:hypothetical protein